MTISRRSLFAAASRTTLAFVALTTPLTLAVTMSGCGGGAKSANVQPGQMPSGETWSGVYFNPVYGYLHLVETDNNVIGKWKRADQSAWGEMSGVKQGNVLHYTWKEHKVGFVGPSGISSGKGYFVYGLDKDQTGKLHGQYGLKDDETGSEWDCVKQRRMEPDLDSIKGESGTSVPATEGKWD